MVLSFVPGTTPKYPASGLIALISPESSRCNHAMSSPSVHIFHPGCDFGGISMAKLVFPHAEGKAQAIYFILPLGSSMPTINICSASHPSFLACQLAILRA